LHIPGKDSRLRVPIKGLRVTNWALRPSQALTRPCCGFNHGAENARGAAMDSDNKTRTAWEQRLSDVGARVEEEVRRVSRYIDEEVVPDVRRNGSTALRAAADQLARLAQHLDDKAREEAARAEKP
jgi:hypothetical protein